MDVALHVPTSFAPDPQVVVQLTHVVAVDSALGWNVPALQVTHDGVEVALQVPTNLEPAGHMVVHAVHEVAVDPAVD